MIFVVYNVETFNRGSIITNVIAFENIQNRLYQIGFMQ
jgi:hypothetical protein